MAPRRRGRRGGRRRSPRIQDSSSAVIVASEVNEVAVPMSESVDLSDDKSTEVQSKSEVGSDAAQQPRRRAKSVRRPTKAAPPDAATPPEGAMVSATQGTEESNKNSQTEKSSDGPVRTDAEKAASRTGRRAAGVRRRARTPRKNSKTESGNGSPDIKSTKPTSSVSATETDPGTAEGSKLNDGSTEVPGHSGRRQTGVRQRTALERKSAKMPNKRGMSKSSPVDVGEETLRKDSSLAPAEPPVPGEPNKNAGFARDGAPVQAPRRGWWQRVTGS